MDDKVNLRYFLALCWISLCLIILLLISPLLQNDVVESEAMQTSTIDANRVNGEGAVHISEDISQGKKLFKSNCATCHNKNMKDPLTGPALAGTTDRWADFPKADLYQWIRNSQLLVQQKHPRALALWERYEPSTMNAFPNLSDEDIASLIAYIER